MIVTNSHVVEGVDNVEVVFADGERVAAEVLASDPLSDRRTNLGALGGRQIAGFMSLTMVGPEVAGDRPSASQWD